MPWPSRLLPALDNGTAVRGFGGEGGSPLPTAPYTTGGLVLSNADRAAAGCSATAHLSPSFPPFFVSAAGGRSDWNHHFRGALALMLCGQCVWVARRALQAMQAIKAMQPVVSLLLKCTLIPHQLLRA